MLENWESTWGSTIHACRVLMLLLRYQVQPLSGTQRIWVNLGLSQYSHTHALLSQEQFEQLRAAVLPHLEFLQNYALIVSTIWSGGRLRER